MATSTRRSARILIQRPGSVEYVTGPGGDLRSTRAPIFVRDLSLEGAGLTCESPCRVPLEPGSQIVLHIPLNGRELVLPASVTWRGEDSPEGREFGAALQLEQASVSARRAYADWIVVRIHSAALQEPDPEPGR